MEALVQVFVVEGDYVMAAFALIVAWLNYMMCRAGANCD